MLACFGEYNATCRQHGLSLVELMVAVLIGSLLLAGTVVIFQQSKSNSLQDEQIARMQENGRYALRLVARELAHVGYFGGVLDTSVLTVNEDDFGASCKDWVSDPGFEPTYVNDGTGSEVNAVFDCISAGDVVAGSDAVGIQRVSDEPVIMVAADGTTTPALGTTTTAGSIYLRTNQSLGVLYDAEVKLDDDEKPISDLGPEGTVPNPAVIRAYLPSIFYVGQQDGIPGLCAETLRNNAMVSSCLVEGIENLQIEYGIDGDGDYAPDYFSSDPAGDADVSASIGDVVAARIHVLVRSVNPITGYENDKTYRLGATEIGPFDDAFYRRVYSTTVRFPNASRLKLQRAGGF